MKGKAVLACLVLAGCSQQPEKDPDNPLGLKMDKSALVDNCLSPEEQRMTPAQMSPEQRQRVIGCIQSQAAEQIRPQLPQQVDALTTLNNVTAEGTMLIYHQTVDIDAATVTADALQEIETRVRTTVCGHPAMRSTIEIGGGYAYRWTDKQGRPLREVRIDGCAAPGAAGKAGS